MRLAARNHERLTVAQLRQFLGSADRVGLPDDTIVICTAIRQTGHIGNLQTEFQPQHRATAGKDTQA